MSMQLPEQDRFDPPPLRLRRPFLTSLAAGLGLLSLLAGLVVVLVAGSALLELPALAPYLKLERDVALGLLGTGALLVLFGRWLQQRSQRRGRYRNSLSLAPELKRRR